MNVLTAEIAEEEGTNKTLNVGIQEVLCVLAYSRLQYFNPITEAL